MKINTKMFSSLNYRSIIIGIIMFTSILAFLFTGFGRVSIFNFRGVDPDTALIVGSQKVDMGEFSRVLSSRGYSNSMPENQKRYLTSQVLQDLIYQKLLLENAQQIGFTANQDEIATFIRSIKVFQDPVTKQFSLERLKQYLSSQQISDIEFFQQIKNELTINNLNQLLILPEVYPTAIAQAQYKIENTQFNLQYALINLNTSYVNEQAKSQVDEFLKKPDSQKELQDLYNAQKAQYNQPTQYQVRSILISYKDAQRAQGSALARSKLEAQQLIDALLTKIQKGADFGVLASLTNDDARAQQNKGDLGYVDETSIDPTSYKALSQLSLSSPLSSVIDTPYGFRIFQLEGKKEGFAKTLDDVKTVLAQELVAQKLRTTLQGEFDAKVRAALTNQSSDTSLETLLASQGILWKSIEKPFTIEDGVLAGLGSASSLSENVFTLKKPGDVIPRILDFGSVKHVLIKLVSMRNPNSPSASDIKELQKKESDAYVQEFFQAYLSSLKESYESKGKIKINPILNQ